MGNLSRKIGFDSGETKTSVICVTSYDHKNCKGVLSDSYFDQEVSFDNITQMLFAIEEMLTDGNDSQGANAKREAAKVRRARPELNDVCRKNALATFKVSILFQQNASWQGNISWIEGGMSSPFRSVLELIRLIDGVLTD